MAYQKIKVPKNGEKITIKDGELIVPDHPIIAFIEGDGTGPDIWAASHRVLEAAVEKAYKGKRSLVWMETYAGEKAVKTYGDGVWLPDETLDAYREFLVGIKGPLTTPIGGGIRSLNVALRQRLDLYVCLRPVKYFEGSPSPVKHPEYIDMVIFRENTEDIYAGIEWMAGTPETKKIVNYLQKDMGVTKIRFPETSSIGIKPVSKEGTWRLVRDAIKYAIKYNRKSVTLVHKGNIMKFTEGAFRDWGYQVAKEEFGSKDLDGGLQVRFDSDVPGDRGSPMDPVWRSKTKSRISASGHGQKVRPLAHKWESGLDSGEISGSETIQFRWKLSLEERAH